MGRVKRLIVYCTILTLVLVSGCASDNKEETDQIEHVTYLRGIVSELTKARLDNRSVDEVQDVFKKYEKIIQGDVWVDAFDTSNEWVVSDLEIAETYGYIPKSHEVRLLNYGTDGETEKEYFTVVAEMKVTDESGYIEEIIDVYMMYEFVDGGMINDFTLVHQLRGDEV